MKRLLLALTLAIASHGAIADPCTGSATLSFRPAKQTEDNVYAEFGGAVVRLVTPTQQGTGFVIDNKNGYILTAAHVISTYTVPRQLISKAASISASSEALPGSSLRVIVKENLWETQGIDAALLQLDPPNSLESVRPVDVIAAAPEVPRHVSFMGYPKIGDNPQLKLQAGGGKVSGELGNGQYLVVETTAFDGESGSPIIDERGRAIGIAIDTGSSSSLTFLPLVWLLETLKSLPPTHRISELDTNLRANTIKCGALVQALIPRSTSSTNVELLVWSAVIAQHPDRYRNSRSYIDWPIIRAFEQRDLYDAIVTIKPLVSSDTLGRAYLWQGRRSTTMYLYASAKSEFREAGTAYLRAIQEHLSESPESMTYALCRAGFVASAPGVEGGIEGGAVAFVDGQGRVIGGDPTEALLLQFKAGTLKVQPKSCTNPVPDLTLFSFLQEYAISRKSEADAITLDEKSLNGIPDIRQDKPDALRDARAAATLAVWASSTLSERANVYAFLGETEEALGNYSNAAEAYATAHKEGLMTPEVYASWTRATSAAIEQRMLHPEVLQRGIDEAPILTKSDLWNTISFTRVSIPHPP